ncbi:MAG: SRPBCC family protein [Cyclobacteriaceae bacterium]
MIHISKHSGIYTLTVMQELPIGLPEAWEFFSSPANLEKITPEHMGFRITSGVPETMYPGQIISYKVSPIPGIKANWVTEITQVEKGKFFVDEQRFGPYSMWHHEHHFEEKDGSVIMTDKISYKIPLGILGHLAHVLFVKRQLTAIFKHRIKVLEEKFER